MKLKRRVDQDDLWSRLNKVQQHISELHQQVKLAMAPSADARYETVDRATAS